MLKSYTNILVVHFSDVLMCITRFLEAHEGICGNSGMQGLETL